MISLKTEKPRLLKCTDCVLCETGRQDCSRVDWMGFLVQALGQLVNGWMYQWDNWSVGFLLLAIDTSLPIILGQEKDRVLVWVLGNFPFLLGAKGQLDLYCDGRRLQEVPFWGRFMAPLWEQRCHGSTSPGVLPSRWGMPRSSSSHKTLSGL